MAGRALLDVYQHQPLESTGDHRHHVDYDMVIGSGDDGDNGDADGGDDVDGDEDR